MLEVRYHKCLIQRLTILPSSLASITTGISFAQHGRVQFSSYLRITKQGRVARSCFPKFPKQPNIFTAVIGVLPQISGNNTALRSHRAPSNSSLMSRGAPMKQYLPTENIIIVKVALVSRITFLLSTGRQRIKMVA